MKHGGRALSGTMLILVGCTHRGPHIATEDLGFEFVVTATEQTMTLEATFRDARVLLSHDEQLDDDDELSVKFRDRTVTLVGFTNPDGATTYRADFTLDEPISIHDSIAFDLERDRYASTTLVNLMPPPIVVTPLPATISRAGDIVLMWTPVTDDTVKWSIVPSDCFAEQGDVADEWGTYTIPGNTVVAIDPSQTCDATLRLERYRLSYKNGSLSWGETLMFVFTDVPFISTP